MHSQSQAEVAAADVLCVRQTEAIAALKHSFYFLRETLLLLTLQPASGVLLQSACSGCVGLP